jgi:hypothetical protein
MGFVMNKATLEQVFLRVLLFSPVNVIPPLLTISVKEAGGRGERRLGLPLSKSQLSGPKVTELSHQSEAHYSFVISF